MRPLLLAAALALAVAGCGQDPAADNHGYGWHYDIESPATGLRLRYEPDVPASDRQPLAVFDAALLEVAACLGQPVRGPLIVVVPRDALQAAPHQAGYAVYGLYYFDTGLIVLEPSLGALRHELVHYLLDRAGFPESANRDHASPLFASCGGA